MGKKSPYRACALKPIRAPDVPAPDWKMVRKTLQTARKAFGDAGPVDRKQERKSRRALDKVCDRIFAHLKKEYSRNIAAKEALVAEAESLAGVEDLRQAIDRAKAIQSEWNAVGLTPVRADRGLPKRLRKACDAVFAGAPPRRPAPSRPPSASVRSSSAGNICSTACAPAL